MAEHAPCHRASTRRRSSSTPTWAGSATTSRRLGKLLDEMPNMNDGDRRRARRTRPPAAHGPRWFMIRYQDRVLFGKDIWEPSEYHTYFRDARDRGRVLPLLPQAPRLLEAVRPGPAGRGPEEALLQERAPDHPGDRPVAVRGVGGGAEGRGRRGGRSYCLSHETPRYHQSCGVLVLALLLSAAPPRRRTLRPGGPPGRPPAGPRLARGQRGAGPGRTRGSCSPSRTTPPTAPTSAATRISWWRCSRAAASGPACWRWRARRRRCTVSSRARRHPDRRLLRPLRRAAGGPGEVGERGLQAGAPLPEPRSKAGRDIPFPAAGGRVDPESRIYGRSASDDKSPIVAMLAALDALQASGQCRARSTSSSSSKARRRPGSDHLRAMLTAHAETCSRRTPGSSSTGRSTRRAGRRSPSASGA